MVVRIAAKGPNAGQQFWGCSTYPDCRAIVKFDFPTPQVSGPVTPNAVHHDAGESAQAEFDKRRLEHRARVRAAWPAFVGLWIVLVSGLGIGFALLGQPVAGGLTIIGLTFAAGYAIVEIPWVIRAWRVGAEGERMTAKHLDGLNSAGFVLLHDRKAPGYGGNVDHVAIGPSGLWVIETKSLRGKVEIEDGALKIGGYRQDKIVDQVYREATAVQIALRTALEKSSITASPVLCLHRSRMPLFGKTVRGVRLASGGDLVRLLKQGPVRLTPEQVQELATAADRLLSPAKPR